MRARTKYLVGIAAAASMMVSGLVVTTQAAAQSDDLDWQECPDAEDGEEVQCATIDVPLDWDNPDGGTIEIGLAKREAANPDERIGSILMGPGGPGASGVDKVVEPQGAEVLADKAAERFDLVSFDPRGVNNSEPVNCDAELAMEYQDSWEIDNAAQFDDLININEELYEDCKQRSGEIVDNADNLQTVEDIDAIRAALGEKELNFLGQSYGTLMGQQYAEAHPDNVRAMVLDGNMDHSITDPWDMISGSVAPAEETFVQFAQWCDTTQECNLEETEAVYADLKEQARAGELVDPETGEEMDFYDLSRIGFLATEPATWSGLAADLKALHEGEGTLSNRDNQPFNDEMNDVYQATWCGDWEYPLDGYDEWEQLTDNLSEEFPNMEWTPYVYFGVSCTGAPVETKNPQQELEVDEDVSMVMVGNQYDASTPYEWSETASEQSGAGLVTYEGYHHLIYGGDSRSDCVNDAIDTYFTELTDPDGLSCPSVEDPE